MMGKDPEAFEMEIRSKDRGLFVDAKPGLVVLGPRSSDVKAGADDHVTVVMNGERIDQVHRKVDGLEMWCLTGERLQAELDSLLANATTFVDLDELKKPNTYIVSANRVKLLFSIVALPLSVFLHFFWRLVATPEVLHRESGVEARIVFEERKIRHLVRSTRLPARWVSRLLQRVPPKVFLQLIRFVGKRILVNPQNTQRLEDDIWFVVSEDRIGLALPSDHGKVRFLSAAPLFDALSRVKSNVPLSLEEFGKLGPGTEFRIKSIFDPPAVS